MGREKGEGSPRFCRSCGTRLSEPAGRFCQSCGAEIGAAADPAPPPTEPATDPAQRARKRSRSWLVALAVLAAAALAAGSAVLLVGGSGGSKDSGETGGAEALPSPAELPREAVAFVSHVPHAMGTITRTELDRAIAQSAAQNGPDSPPPPGSPKYKEAEEAAMRELIEAVWLRGEGTEMGISVTPNQIQTELAQIRKQSFDTAKAYREFLATSHFSQQDVLGRVELQILSKRIEEQIVSSVPSPSNSEISDFYDSAKATQFTTAPSRDVRVVVNKSAAKIAEAKSLLDRDDSVASWKRVAREFSSDSAGRKNGGLTPGVTEDLLKEPLKAVVFQSSPGEVVGPVGYEGKQLVIEVEKVNPRKVQPLESVRSQIRRQLIQQAKQEKTKEFVDAYDKRWRARTVCVARYAIEDCSNGPAPSQAPQSEGTGSPATR